jgi:hypothetical protein
VDIQTNATVVMQSNETAAIQPSLAWTWASVPDSSRAPYDACGNVQPSRVCDVDYVLTQTQRVDIQGAYMDKLGPLLARA